MLTRYVWILTYLTSISLLFASFVLLWGGISAYLKNKNNKKLFFAIGLLTIFATSLVFKLNGLVDITLIVFGGYAIGFIFINYSLAKRLVDLMPMLLLPLPLLMTNDSIWFALTPLAMLPIIWLNYRNHCDLLCHNKECQKRRQKENIEWAMFFVFIMFSSIAYIVSINTPLLTGHEIILVLAIAFELIALILLLHHNFYCEHYKSNEKILLSFMISFFAALIFSSFALMMLVDGYVKSYFEEDLRARVTAIKYLTEADTNKEEFILLLKEKNPKLNNIADEIFAKTGFRTTYFLNNERVGGTVSPLGGRFLGTKINNQEIIDTVLIKGEVYSGIIFRDTHYVVAAYLPIYEEDQIIGMYSTGQSLGDIEELKKSAIKITLLISFIPVSGSLAYLVYSKKPKNLK